MIRSTASRSVLRQSTRYYSNYGARAVRRGNIGLSVLAGSTIVAGLALVFQDRFVPVAFCDAAIASVPDNSRVEPASGISFPQRLQTISQSDVVLRLLGLGVRTVSFLRVKVYAAGFYIDPEALKFIEKNPIPSTDENNSHSIIERLISQRVACGVRIVPTRSTDFGHLRDGFARALTARQKAASKAGKLSELDQERISNSVQTFKGFFPSAAVPKGKELLLLKTTKGQLCVEYDGRVLGQLDDEWIAREMMMAYFASENVISAPLKTDVAVGLESITK